MLAAARAAAQSAAADIALAAGRVERMPFASASFDCATAVTVLCFMRDPGAVLRELARVLAPGGVLVIGELSRWSLWALRRRMRGWLGSRVWRRAHFTHAAELRRLLAQAGFTVESLEGAVFYPPSALLARCLEPAESRLRGLTTFGAAFVAARARKSVA
jgi:ubiquinone/menaquinone biosynthesis C-methylase UbiE